MAVLNHNHQCCHELHVFPVQTDHVPFITTNALALISRNNYPGILKIHERNIGEFCFLEMLGTNLYSTKCKTGGESALDNQWRLALRTHVCFYIAQYPVRWTIQRTSHHGRLVHCDTNLTSLVSVLATHEDYSLTFPPQSTAVYRQVLNHTAE